MTDRLELLAVVALGFLLDQVLGDPHWLYHPVRLIGAYISFLEKGIRKLFGEGERALLAGGVVLVVLVTGTTAVVSGGILYTCGRISPWLRFLASVILCYQLFAVKSLKDESMKVYRELKKDDLEAARYDWCHEGGGGDSRGKYVRRCCGTALLHGDRRTGPRLGIQGSQYDGFNGRV